MLLGLLVVAIVLGLGLVAPTLLWIALVLLLVWLLGFVVRRRGARWYAW